MRNPLSYSISTTAPTAMSSEVQMASETERESPALHSAAGEANFVVAQRSVAW